MPNKNHPLLSICIPTYNRCVYLKQSLEALVNNKAFDDEVEIVISDNCSTDNTENVGKEFAIQYHNIKYFRNSKNVKDANFCLAMDRATGLYAKLMNDNTIILDDGLQYMKDVVRKNVTERRALFFTNGVLLNTNKKVDEYLLTTFEDFVIHLSFFVTAISCFGAWKEDWEKVSNRTRYTELCLNQDDWAYQIMERRCTGLLCSRPISQQISIDKKNRTGYNWFEVHVANYYKILQPYINKGLVSKKALTLEKKTYLNGLKAEIVTCYFYNLRSDWDFDMTGTSHILWKYFKNEPYFYFYFISLPFWGAYLILKHIAKLYLSKIIKR